LSGNCFWPIGAWKATLKLVCTVAVLAPSVTRALTATCSPDSNGRAGMKLSPVPVE
jgi:hypothetical protein